MYCNNLTKKENATPELLNSDPCNISILLQVEEGCPAFDIKKIVETIQNVFIRLGYFLCVILILSGFGIGIFGIAMWNKIVFLFLSIIFSAIFLVIVFDFLFLLGFHL